MTIILRGGSVSTHGSEHRTVHDILENDLLDRYRLGGDRHGQLLTVREYNNAMAHALVEIGVEPEELKFIMGLMIIDQKHHGYEPDHTFDSIPKRVASIGVRAARNLKKIKIF